MALESIFTATSPSTECDKERALATANYFLDRRGDGQERYILISGEYNTNRSREDSQQEYIKGLIFKRGVSLDDIEQELSSSNTRENVFYSGQMFFENNTDSVVITSDYWHALRLAMLFSRAITELKAPRDLKIQTNHQGLSPSYPLRKALPAFAKDLILPIKGHD